jgi:hypothetical protein
VTLSVPDQVNAMLDRFLEILALREASEPEHAAAAMA